MLSELGGVGWAGIAIVLVGLATIAYAEPVVAVGLALVLAGLGLLAKRGYDAVMGMFGMA